MNTTEEIMALTNESAELTRRLAGVQRQIEVIYPEVPGEFLEPQDGGAEVRVGDGRQGHFWCQDLPTNSG